MHWHVVTLFCLFKVRPVSTVQSNLCYQSRLVSSHLSLKVNILQSQTCILTIKWPVLNAHMPSKVIFSLKRTTKHDNLVPGLDTTATAADINIFRNWDGIALQPILIRHSTTVTTTNDYDGTKRSNYRFHERIKGMFWGVVCSTGAAST